MIFHLSDWPSGFITEAVMGMCTLHCKYYYAINAPIMASSPEKIRIERALSLIERLAQPEASHLTERRQHPSMPPLDSAIDPAKGGYILRHFYRKVLPGQWGEFMNEYRSGAPTDDLTMRLTSTIVYAQLARVLTLEMMGLRYRDAVGFSTMMLDYSVESIAAPLKPGESQVEYEGEGGLVPIVDVGSIVDELPGRDNPYFDMVLVRMSQHMTNLCIERDVSVG